MKISQPTLKKVQEWLKEAELNPGAADGVMGKNTIRALDKVEGIDPGWGGARKAIAFIQLTAQKHGLDTGKVDGRWGPVTDAVYDDLKECLATGNIPQPWRDEIRKEVNPHGWPKDRTADMMDYFGEVGTRQVKLELPYPHKLSWDTDTVVHKISCHELVHDSLLKVLTDVFEHYGQEKIEELGLDLFGGCLNVRKKRGGSTYSTHSWGVALDYHPAKNKLKWGRDRALFSRTEYDAWWKCWEAEGWVSLGRERNFDWMHVQAAKLP